MISIVRGRHFERRASIARGRQYLSGYLMSYNFLELLFMNCLDRMYIISLEESRFYWPFFILEKHSPFGNRSANIFSASGYISRSLSSPVCIVDELH